MVWKKMQLVISNCITVEEIPVTPGYRVRMVGITFVSAKKEMAV
jgi:hypothetical protein